MPDTIFSAGSDNTVRIWSLSKGAEVKRLTGHKGAVYDIAVSPKGDILASVGADRTLRLWDTKNGAEVTRFKGHTGDVLRCTPQGKFIATASSDHTEVWHIDTHEEIHRFRVSGIGQRSRLFADANQLAISEKSN